MESVTLTHMKAGGKKIEIPERITLRQGDHCEIVDRHDGIARLVVNGVEVTSVVYAEMVDDGRRVTITPLP